MSAAPQFPLCLPLQRGGHHLLRDAFVIPDLYQSKGDRNFACDPGLSGAVEGSAQFGTRGHQQSGDQSGGQWRAGSSSRFCSRARVPPRKALKTFSFYFNL